MCEDTQKRVANQAEIVSLEDVVRLGAQQLLKAALEAEIQTYLAQFAELKTPEGRQAVVRNGFHRSRTVTSCHGPVEVAVPARVHARVRGKRGPIYDMEAWLVQDEQIRARARARFVDHQGVSWP